MAFKNNFFKKRTVIRGHQFDTQSAALLSLLPKKDLSELLDDEIAKSRIRLEESRMKFKVSLTPSMQVKKVDHTLSKHKLLLREYKPSQVNLKKLFCTFMEEVTSLIQSKHMMIWSPICLTRWG